MNSFYEHHRDSIHWHYRCFDRILLNGLIQPFQQPERVVGWGRMFVRICPYLPFSARICLNQQHWLANRLRENGIGFKQLANALKLFERIYAPLTAGLLSHIKADAKLESQRRSQLDRLYQRVVDDLDTLVRAVGLKAA